MTLPDPPTGTIAPAPPGTKRAHLEQVLRMRLPKSQHTKIPKLALHIARLYAAPWGQARSVEIRHARVTVETVTAYGLDIELDAMGEATAVHFPDQVEPHDVDTGDLDY